MIRPSAQVAAGGWLAGSAAALVIQGLFRRRFAQDTAWGYNGGWQREIAVWNLGTIVVGTSLITMGERAARAQVRGYAVLSTLFGINHLVAALGSRRRWSNWAGALSNAVGLTVCLAALNSSRTTTPDQI